jgi:hypothetical protein
MKIVGRDVIVYEREQRESAWKASEDYSWAQRPILNLAGVLGLGTLLRPETQAGAPGAKDPSSTVGDLFHAAKSNRDASHALLSHTPDGWKQSMLDYLLTIRWGASRYQGDYAPLNDMLVTATTGQDATSQEMAAGMIKIITSEMSKAFGQAADGNLEIRNRETFDRLAPLSYPLARAISANIDQLSRLYLNRETFFQVAPQDMSYALVLATSHDAGFEALVRAQTEHMRAALDTVPPVGLNSSNAERLGFTVAEVKGFDRNGNGRVDAADTTQFLIDRTVEEAIPFNHMVETRRQVLIAQGLDDKKADESLKAMVANAIGLLPVPGSKQMGELATGAFGEMVSKGYEKLSGVAYDELSRQVAQRISEQGRSLDDGHKTSADNYLAVERLAEQMLATAMLNKGILDGLRLENQTFVVGTPPRLKPFPEMTPQEYSNFLEWNRAIGGSSDILNRFNTTFQSTKQVSAYLGLGIQTSRGDE